MTALSRRDFLAAGPAAAMIPLAVPFHAAAQGQVENPILIELGKAQPGIEAAYLNACAAWDAMWCEWNPKWPLAPAPCLQGGGWPTEFERDLTGRALIRAEGVGPLRLLSLKDMEWRRDNMLHALAKDAKRKKPSAQKTLDYWQSEVDRAELGIALLPGYLEECERIRRASNYKHINDARGSACERMFSFAREVLEVPSHTIEGVRIKASAVAALGRLRQHDATWGNLADITGSRGHMGALLAQALLGVASPYAASCVA